jgi:hypothetical protein
VSKTDYCFYGEIRVYHGQAAFVSLFEWLRIAVLFNLQQETVMNTFPKGNEASYEQRWRETFDLSNHMWNSLHKLVPQISEWTICKTAGLIYDIYSVEGGDSNRWDFDRKLADEILSPLVLRELDQRFLVTHLWMVKYDRDIPYEIIHCKPGQYAALVKLVTELGTECFSYNRGEKLLKFYRFMETDDARRHHERVCGQAILNIVVDALPTLLGYGCVVPRMTMTFHFCGQSYQV